MQIVKSATFDQRFHRALVDACALDPHTKVVQRLERPALFARRHNRRDRLLACALDSAQTVAHAGVAGRLKPVVTAVDVRRLELDTHSLRVTKQDFELVGVVHFHRHVRGKKLGGVVHLEPGRVVRQQSVRSRV